MNPPLISEREKRFPASCTYTTAVKGTHKSKPEVVAFFEPDSSRISPRPAYQDKAIAEYFALNNDFPQFARSTSRQGELSCGWVMAQWKLMS